MVELGVGKNMVTAIRFWAEAASVAANSGRDGWAPLPFGEAIFGAAGHDPYLENTSTLWLIHWNLATNFREPLFAWDYLLNSWHRTDFTASDALDAFRDESQRLGKKLSPVTLEHHFTTFLHTYVPTCSRKGQVLEDNLDCPLVELELVRKVGERGSRGGGRREPIYAFRMEEKPEISPALFVYALADFWEKRGSTDDTLAFRDVSVGHGSPGQVFKLPEAAIRDRLEHLERDSAGAFTFRESAALPQVVRVRHNSLQSLLKRVYRA